MKRFLTAVFPVLLLLCSLVPMTAFAQAPTYTIRYMTNAEVEMGVVSYPVGDSGNAFPTTSEFSNYFYPFLIRAAQNGSIAVAPQCWYKDPEFTTPATFPDGQAGENYTVYCKFTTGLSITSVGNGAQNKSYANTQGPVQPHLSVDWEARNGRNDQYPATAATFEKLVDGVWTEVDDSYYTDYRNTSWLNAIWFSNVSDSGLYRLKYLRYTATDLSGDVLYYDTAYDDADATYEVSILPVELTVSDVQAVDRPYDGTSRVGLTGGTLSGVRFGDDVSFVLGEGEMADAAEGSGKPVTTAIALTGAKAGNYTLTQPTGLTVDITCSPVYVPAKDPTCTESGNIACWYCEACGRYFLDEAATQEVAAEKIVLSPAGHRYENGVCAVCGTADPDYVPPTPTPAPSQDSAAPPSTGDGTPLRLWAGLLVLSGVGMIAAVSRRALRRLR